MLTLIIPIGPIISMLSNWLQSAREKLRRDSRLPHLKNEVKVFGFKDALRLPGPANDAVALAELEIARHDFERAKHLLINCWLLCENAKSDQLEFLRLREGFVRLYSQKGEDWRAKKIAEMPISLLDREIQWLVQHPDEQVGASLLKPDS
ncbi:MAG: hypothetical protein K2X27_23580 [Candidatus Obscuribacterales bacterium]|nr:hypothetical protein [Candidatus Obscuribacterales bacterium]